MGRSKKIKTSIRALKKAGKDNKVPEWVMDINTELLEGLGYESGRSWTIYRVPRNLCDVHRSSFIPKIISIGPFHYGDHSLQVMEEHKKRYLFRLLGFRCQTSSKLGDPPKYIRDESLLETLAGDMKLLEKKTRECYSETFHIKSDEFVQMMVTDGCFVVELLRLYYKFEKEENVDDPIFTTRWMLRTLQRDLLMLENQLPFFVIEKLFELTSLGDEPSLEELTVKFFNPLIPRTEELRQINSKVECAHLLDLFRSSFVSPVINKKPTGGWRERREMDGSGAEKLVLVEERQLIYCVSELQEAGVKFMKIKDSDLLNVEFENRTLKIPTLYIDDNTVPLFLNFVAYEQCDENKKPYFTDHFMFFDSLVNSANDVSILHKNGIINHVLGSDKDVACLFNKLGREIIYDVEDCHLAKQMKDVNDYYRAYSSSRFQVWWTNLISNYFSSPWTFLSLFAAVVLLLLTVAQTLIAAYAYFRPPSVS